MTKQSQPRGLRELTFKSRQEAEAYFSSLSDCISDVRFVSDDPHPDIGYAGGTLGHTEVHRGAVPELKWRAEESGSFHFVVPQRGKIVVADGTGEAEAGRSALLLPPASRGRVDVPARLNAISLIAPRAAMSAQASKMLGRDIRSSEFVDGVQELPLADPLTMAVARNLTACVHELLTLGHAGISDLARAQFDDLLVGLLTTIVVPEVREGLSDRRIEAGSAVVRRAQDYIREHAADAIRLADLAESLGIGLRTLQLSFRRHIGVSPREYLMQCRLDLARARLLSGGTDTKVATVAFECGFTDLSLFSRKYRNAFGELPSATLRRR